MILKQVQWFVCNVHHMYVITVIGAELCNFSFAQNTVIRGLILNDTEVLISITF